MFPSFDERKKIKRIEGQNEDEDGDETTHENTITFFSEYAYRSFPPRVIHVMELQSYSSHTHVWLLSHDQGAESVVASNQLEDALFRSRGRR